MMNTSTINKIKLLAILAITSNTARGTKPLISQNENPLIVLKSSEIWSEGIPLKLHLGCGEQHFKGYVNIDFPPSEHTVQANSVADVFADLNTLSFPQFSIDEVRSHHVLEHFDRSTALALLCKWHHWLKVGGTILVETPDFDQCIKMLNSSSYTYEQKQVTLRHVFGSHEAKWAIHCDGWYEEKFRRIFSAIGFTNISFEFIHWPGGLIPSIAIRAVKKDHLDKNILQKKAYQLLRSHMVCPAPSEEKMWRVWCASFDKIFNS